MEHQPLHADSMLHACVGVMCEMHERCARYTYIDGSREHSIGWLGTCATSGEAGLPGFIDVAFIGPPRPYHFGLTRQSIGRASAPSHERAMT